MAVEAHWGISDSKLRGMRLLLLCNHELVEWQVSMLDSAKQALSEEPVPHQ
ncbi:Unannotated [Lentimonas sp. CC19]|nr:Unannotated [Lentimonas sp. CC19]CAA6693509.1 Unannotated [Lentimonas sp. CC10]CAA7070813.1 Unannotated [Lentimonas sp. CC11]CAA7077942.1 Unannotated [Lentimonas sp. CC4]